MDAARKATLSAAGSTDVIAAILANDAARLKILLRLPSVQFSLAAAEGQIVAAIVSRGAFELVGLLQPFLGDIVARLLPAALVKMKAACCIDDVATLERMLSVAGVADFVVHRYGVLSQLMTAALEADAAPCLAVLIPITTAQSVQHACESAVHAATFRRALLLHAIRARIPPAMRSYVVVVAALACTMLADAEMSVSHGGAAHDLVDSCLQLSRVHSPYHVVMTMIQSLDKFAWRFSNDAIQQLALLRSPSHDQPTTGVVNPQHESVPLEERRRMLMPPPGWQKDYRQTRLPTTAQLAHLEGTWQGNTLIARMHIMSLTTSVSRFYAWARRRHLIADRVQHRRRSAATVR